MDYPSDTYDHAPIIVAVIDNILVKSTDNHPVIPKIQRYEWDKIDLARYNKYLQLNLDEIQHKQPNNGKEIDNLLMHLTNVIKKAADECVPSKHVKQKGHKHRIWSPEIARCVKDNKTAFGNTSRLQQTRTRLSWKQNVRWLRGIFAVPNAKNMPSKGLRSVTT